MGSPDVSISWWVSLVCMRTLGGSALECGPTMHSPLVILQFGLVLIFQQPSHSRNQHPKGFLPKLLPKSTSSHILTPEVTQSCWHPISDASSLASLPSLMPGFPLNLYSLCKPYTICLWPGKVPITLLPTCAPGHHLLTH